MPQISALRFALPIVVLVSVFSAPFAHANETAEELEAKLAEAKRLLEADKASHEATAEKKRLIDEKLAARQQRADEIKEELTLLCEEQEKLSPGTLDECLAKLDN